MLALFNLPLNLCYKLWFRRTPGRMLDYFSVGSVMNVSVRPEFFHVGFVDNIKQALWLDSHFNHCAQGKIHQINDRIRLIMN